MMKTISYIFLAIFTTNFHTYIAYEIPDDWVDPHDISISKEYSQFSNNKVITENYGYTKSLAEAYFKRTINMLLNSVHEDIIEDNTYSGHLFIKIDVEKYRILKNFADGLTNDLNLEDVDRILAEMLNKPTHEYLQEYLETWFHKFLNILLSREGIIALTIISFNFVIYKMKRANFYSIYVIKYLFFNFFLFDMIFTWIYLYQLEKAKELSSMAKYKNMSNDCDPNNMNTWHFLLNLLSNEDKCEQFYKIQFQDIFFKVTPGVVLSEMFARTIQYPAKAIGSAFGDISYGIYSSLPIGINIILTPILMIILLFLIFNKTILSFFVNSSTKNANIYCAFPFPLNIIILPILLLLFCLMTFIIISLALSKPVKINFLHLFKFSFGGETNLRPQNQDVISGDNLKTLLQLTTNLRQFVEDIPIEKSSEEEIKCIKPKEKDENTNKNEENIEIEDKNNDVIPKIIKTSEKIEEKAELGGGDCK